MPTSPKLGNYEIDLGDPELQKTIVHASFRQTLDDFSVFSVEVATNAESMDKWRLQNHPTEARFSWDGKAIFKGHLLSAAARGHARIVLTYVDNLFLATKGSGNQFVKQQTLRDCLQKLVTNSELQPQFHGTFSEMLAGFQQGNASVFDLVTALSNKHGFHFVTRSGNQVNFLKPGKGLSTVNIDAAKEAASVHFQQSAGSSYNKVLVRYFDPKNIEAKDTNLPSQTLYNPLSAFTGESAFQEKSKWKTAAGTLEANLTDRHHFQNGQNLLAEQFSKKALEQEGLQMAFFEPIALPGDLLKVSGCPVPAIQNGTYLVASGEITITSALPKLTLMGIRA